MSKRTVQWKRALAQANGNANAIIPRGATDKDNNVCCVPMGDAKAKRLRTLV